MQANETSEINIRYWLAAYTRSLHEQQVDQQLQHKSVECLLPIYERRVRWTDRVKLCRAPLFPGYVFVHILDTERSQVLQTVGVVNLVSRAGLAVTLSAE